MMTSSVVDGAIVGTSSVQLLSTNGRFTEMRTIGHGGSGEVYGARDLLTKSNVALKKLTFTDRQTTVQALREIRLLRKLVHENVVHISDVLNEEGATLDQSQSSPECVYLVQDLFDTDLHHVISANLVTPAHSRCFIYQILCALKYIHSANIIHRDLKPSNILVDCQQLRVKISDFGLSRVVDPNYNHAGYLTERVGTCWYLAPEQILTPRDYFEAVDMWSAGCVFSEMLLGRAAFPGVNELNQMLLILDSIHLEEDDWGGVLRVMPNKLLKNHPYRPRTPLAEKLLHITTMELDLLESMLTFDARRRVCARDALTHSCLAEYSNRAPSARTPLSIELEIEPDSSQALRNMILDESSGSVTCGSCYSPPASPHSSVNTSTNSVDCNDDAQDNTHTLDEILQIEERRPDTDCLSDLSSSSVEDLNMRNLRHSQDDLHTIMPSPHVCNTCHSTQKTCNTCQKQRNNQPTCSSQCDTHNCYDLLGATQGTTIQNYRLSQTPTVSIGFKEGSNLKAKDDDDEKDVAEPSLQKLVEDKELEGGAGVISSTEQHLFITVNNEHMENLKETSQISPKHCLNAADNTASYSQVTQTSIALTNDDPRNLPLCSASNVARCRPPNDNASLPDSDKELKLVEYNDCFYNYSKFDADNQLNEKSNRSLTVNLRHKAASSELDEMYRLPTDHLRIDRDYSNERIKHKRLTKAQRQYLAKYREEINELNERLKEASLDGAVGGVMDTTEQQVKRKTTHPKMPVTQKPASTGSVADGGVNSPSIHSATRRNGIELANHQRVAVACIERQRQRNITDGFSSPEENPSSPRASFSTGARPKKSPRKQKAL